MKWFGYILLILFLLVEESVYGQEAIAFKEGTVKNSIVWKNFASDSVTVVPSLNAGITAKNSCTAEDPLLENFQLKPGSPCINKGDSLLSISAGMEYDLRGEWRIIGSRIDIGAFESLDMVHNGDVVFVKNGGTGSGISWENATGSMAAALKAASGTKQVWVSSGEYRSVEELKIGVTVLGGFSGTETGANQRKAATNICILNGGGVHRVATITGVLEGFTVTNGNTARNGGGVILKNTGTIRNCRIENNKSGQQGGGIYGEGGLVAGCLILHNGSCGDGCAVGGNGWELVNNTIVENNFLDKVVLKPVGVPGNGQSVNELNFPNINKEYGSPYFQITWKLDGLTVGPGYQFSAADNGKKLKCTVTNRCGDTQSNEVIVAIP